MRTIIFIISFGLLGLYSCQSNSPSEQQQETAAVPTNNQVDAPEILAVLFNPNTGVFRGMDFGKTQEAVTAQETAELVEKTDTLATYSVDFSDQEFADIRYVTKGGNLVKMEVDIYAATPESAVNYFNQLKEFFNAKYLPRTDGLWDGAEGGVNYTAYLKLIEEEAAPGVLIVWERI